MFDEQPTMELLFQQLGLDSSDQAIEHFTNTHQLDQDTALHDASFWTEAQRNFLISHWKKDDEWAIIVDRLNAQLHAHDGGSQ